MAKIVIFDGGVLTFRSILAKASMLRLQAEGKLPRSGFIPPSSYTFFNIIISSLRKIGLDKEDLVILALDGRNSWRKCFYRQYKGTRKEQRDKQEFVDWDKEFTDINRLIEKFKESMDWNIIKLDKCWNYADLLFTKEGQGFLTDTGEEDYFEEFGIESDDIIAGAVKYYKNHDVVWVSIDADLDQLVVYPNAKPFSLMMKYKNSKGMYKYVKDGYDILAKKIDKGDKGDNIIPGVTDNNTDEDVQIRRLIIDLISLPSWVEEKVFDKFDNFKKQPLDYSLMPYPKLAKRYEDVYKKTNIITYEECIGVLDSRKKMTAKKTKERKELKKKEEESLNMRG